MLHKIGNKNFTLIQKMMSLHSARNKVIAQNVANVNTPNYRRRELKFDTALANALEGGTSADYRAIRGWVDRPQTTPVRNNGNNVDIDMEMMALKGNGTTYGIYAQLYSRRATMVKTAIRGS